MRKLVLSMNHKLKVLATASLAQETKIPTQPSSDRANQPRCRASSWALLLLLANLGIVWGVTNETQTTDVPFTAASDGTEQRYVLVVPPGFKPEQPHDVLIALHGHGADRWQFVRDPRDECRAARDVAAAQGMSYVSPDYRAKTSWMGPQAETDLVQVIGELKKTQRVARVFLCGGSMGGTASLTFAALHPELVAGVASMNGTANLVEYAGFPDAIAASFGGSKTAIPEEYRKRSAEFWPERFTMPVGITAGGKDDVVPSQSVGRLANELKARGRDVLLIHRAEGGHATTYADARAIIEFVIQKARPASVSSAAAPAPPLTEWRFDRDGDFEGWQPNAHLTDVAVTNGELRCRAVGSDPILELQTRLAVQADPWDVIELRLKADRDGLAEIFWSNTTTGRYGGFSQEKSTRFPITGDHEWHPYQVRPFWHPDGQIVRLRFDLYDATSFELDSFRILKAAVPALRAVPEFDFASGAQAWRGADGAEVLATNGALAVILRAASGLAVAPPVRFPAGQRTNLSLRLAVDRGRYATLMFATAARAGLQRFSFPIYADGREHTYNLDPRTSRHWDGEIIALALRPTDEVGATAHLRWLRASDQPQGEPELAVRYFGVEEFPVRAGPDFTLAAKVANAGGATISNLVATVRLPEGVRLITPLQTAHPFLAPGQDVTLRWTVAARKPRAGTATVEVHAPNSPAATAVARLDFTAIPKSAQRGYVPVPKPVRGPIEVGAYYFPGWPGAKQWQPIQAFPERRPVLGWYREGDPEVADWHIKWAVEHGITFFIYDWYWVRGQRQLEHGLHDGYFKARYRSLLKFCLLWANHNPPDTSSREDCLNVTRFWIENYFRQPEHVMMDGKPVVIIFAPENLTRDLGPDKVRSVLDAMRAECARAGLKGLYFMARVNSAAEARQAAAEGYDAVTSYTWPHLGVPAGEFRAPFATILEGYRHQWQHILDTADIPLVPPVCGGWDSRPWHGENDFIRFDRTPELFRQHLLEARQFLENNPTSPRLRNMLILEAWNEWGEGSYIEPHTEYGFGYLDAIRSALTPARAPHADVAPVDVGRGPFDVPGR